MILRTIRERAPWIGIAMPILALVASVGTMPAAPGRNRVQLVSPAGWDSSFTPTTRAARQLSHFAAPLRKPTSLHTASAALSSRSAFDLTNASERPYEKVRAAASLADRYSRLGRAPPSV